MKSIRSWCQMFNWDCSNRIDQAMQCESSDLVCMLSFIVFTKSPMQTEFRLLGKWLVWTVLLHLSSAWGCRALKMDAMYLNLTKSVFRKTKFFHLSLLCNILCKLVLKPTKVLNVIVIVFELTWQCEWYKYRDKL